MSYLDKDGFTFFLNKVKSKFQNYYNKDSTDDLLDLKQDVLTFDNTPISGSSNPVTSAGIKTALDNILISGNGGSIIKVHHIAGAAAAGNIVMASKGDYSVSSTFDISGNAIIIGFGEIGNITITATNGSETGTKIINIPNFSVYETTVSYGLDYNSWLIAGGIDPSYYDSLDEVLEDEEVVRRLMTIHASVDYLATLDRTNDEMALTLFNNDICAKWINLRDYALDTLYANEYTKAIMDEADKYGYGEWTLMPQVPTMTSNTAPYGEVIVSAIYATGYEAWRVFDGNGSTEWASPIDAASAYIGYKFMQAVNVRKVSCLITSGDSASIPTYKVQYSDDGVTWSDTSEDSSFTAVPDETVMVNIDDGSHLYWRLQGVSRTGRFYYVRELQFYTWQPKGNVPVMTSNTAPYGTVSASSYEQCSPYYAFDQNMANQHGFISNRGSSPCYVGYNFVNPIKLKKTTLIIGSTQNLGSTTITFKVQYSDDGSTWNDIPNATIDVSKTTDTAYWQTYTILINDFDEYHLYYRVYSAQPLFVAGSYALITHVQFYGREMKVSVPTMTSNTAPYGTISYSSIYGSAYEGVKAFNGTIAQNDYWHSNTTNAWLQYAFVRPVCIKRIGIVNYIPYGIRDYEIVASNDNFVSDIHILNSGTFEQGSSWNGKWEYIDIDNDSSYVTYRIHATSTYNPNGRETINELQFFGFDYTERDWDTEHPMTYLYDHGLELTDTIISVANTSGNTFIKEPSRLTINKTTTSAWNAMYPTNQIDVTDYTLARAVSTDGTGINGTASLATCSNLSTGATDSYKVMATNLAPYHQYNNMASINTSRWITIGFGTNVTGDIAISEWWLEQ